ncbi:queuosine precursor transporter [Helcobacillus sp. ACRRO]|uniref:queuosine precursor transporter n=1 Tax=Helcobacillus TaxID=1161125 RepID=UPI001EF63235|nr:MULTISPECIES: queuosine precursor transporter [Helcobacillus]MCG7426957.1 queuosine precursor transporter [Helcobacillus sp. ACRRO]MDK7741105.1 queuosine precursor transporter [Helcobacillus massiliensis]WOO93914.1 queuosine precursor transporter [Helcobacillus massiliensis]
MSRTAVYADRGNSHFDILVAVQAVVVILSGIGAAKGVLIGPVITDAAFFLFPIAYIMGDIITEMYGPAAARRAILTSFVLNVLAVLVYQVIIALPGFTDDYGIEKQHGLEVALGPVWIIVVASLAGFLAGQTVNSLVVARMKARMGEKGLMARLFSASGLGELVDTIIFCTIAATAIGITTLGDWANYTAFGFLYKVLVQYAAVPATAAVIRWMKRTDPSYQARMRAADSSIHSDIRTEGEAP